MSKQKKFFMYLSPAVPFLIVLSMLFVGFIYDPVSVQAVSDLSDGVGAAAVLYTLLFVYLIEGIFDYVALFKQRHKKLVSLEILVDDGIYSELQEMADRTGVKYVSDVIPGVLEYVLDGLRDQEVQCND